MEYNNYYPVQSGHPMPNQQLVGGPQMQQQVPPQSGGQIMHSPMPQQNIRQAMPPGPPNHSQQMQQMQSQQQHIGNHPQQLNPQQQHPSYQQIQPAHPHGTSVSHSSSPHAQQQQQQQHQHHHHQHQHQHHNHNHQSNMSGSLPQPQGISQHVHPQSPHHHGGPMHMQQQQPLNSMARPQAGPAVINHPQPGLQQSIHHQQNFFSAGPMPQQPNMHHYSPNPHHPNHQPQHQPPPVMHHIPPVSSHHPHMQQSLGRNPSPYYPNVLQTEFRLIELCRRLQCRPISRHPHNPLPSAYDESIWWEKFASDFFEDDATMTIRMHDDKPVEHTMGRALIPRFFRSYYTGGVTDLSITLRNPKETCIHPHMITLDCDQAFIVTNNIFRHPSIASYQGIVVQTEGHLIIDFVNNSYDNLSIKSWRFYIRGSREFIDRSIVTSMGLPTSYLAEPVTKNGFTKSTITYIKMCLIMEPMQELMYQHKQTKMDPRSCLRKLLFDRYKFRSGEDNRTTTNKRRKRKPSTPAVTNNATTNKKSKVGLNNAMGSNAGINNHRMSPSSIGPNFSLASQDVMVVGEPSMMGGDFGDDNERMITRLENTQYDPTASNQSTVDGPDGATVSTGGEANNISAEIEQDLDNHTIASPMIHLQQQQQQQPQQLSPSQQQHHQQSQPHQQEAHHPVLPQQIPLEQLAAINATSIQNQGASTPLQTNEDHKVEMKDLQPSSNDLNLQLDGAEANVFEQQYAIDESRDLVQNEDRSDGITPPISQNGNAIQSLHHETRQIVKEEMGQDDVSEGEDKSHQVFEESTINSISDVSIDASIMNNVCSVEPSENHISSVQIIHEEPNSNSQLPCSTPATKPAIEQQQPVDNGVA